MTVYEKVRQLQLGVFVIVTKPFAREEVRFYSHEVDKLRESERFNGFMNLNVKAVRNIPALLQVEIVADEPGCKVFDYEYRITGNQRSNNIHNINANNKIAEFACRVCHKK